MTCTVLISPCFICDEPFQCSPLHVPLGGPPENAGPVCRPCMESINRQREQLGELPYHIHPMAYEPEEAA